MEFRNCLFQGPLGKDVENALSVTHLHEMDTKKRQQRPTRHQREMVGIDRRPSGLASQQTIPDRSQDVCAFQKRGSGIMKCGYLPSRKTEDAHVVAPFEIRPDNGSRV